MSIYSHSSFSSDSSSDTQDEKERKRKSDKVRNSETHEHAVDPGRMKTTI